MNRSLAQWLAEHPGGAVVASAFLVVLPLFGFGLTFFMIGAVPAFVVLTRGPRRGVMVAIAAGIVATAVVMAFGRPASNGLMYSAAMLLLPVALALLFVRTGSLSLCVQVATLAAIGIVVALHGALGEPERVLSPLIQDLARQFQSSGMSSEDTDTLLQATAKTLWGSIAVLVMLGAVLSLFVARWMQAMAAVPKRPEGDPLTTLAVGLLITVAIGLTFERSLGGAILMNLMLVVVLIWTFAKPRQATMFSREFQQVRLGMAIAVAAVVVMIVAAWTKSPAVLDVAGLFVCGFTLVGFSAAHAAKARGTINAFLLAVMYVLTALVAPVVGMLMALWGFVENWIRSRRNLQGLSA